MYHTMEEDMDVNCGDILDGASVIKEARGDGSLKGVPIIFFTTASGLGYGLLFAIGLVALFVRRRMLRRLRVRSKNISTAEVMGS